MQDLLSTNLNTLIAPIAGLVIILADCWKKRYSDNTLQRLMGLIILFALSSMASEMVFNAAYISMADGAQQSLMVSWAAFTLRMMFQTIAFVLTAVFLDYCIYADSARLKRLSTVAILICAAYFVMLIINLYTGYLFTIGRGYNYELSINTIYFEVDYPFIRSIIPCAVLLYVAINALVYRTGMKRGHVSLVMFAALLPAIGSVLDIVMSYILLIWPFFFVSILFCYLFIVRTNTIIDSLTGVYNRRGCDEYLLELSKTLRRKDYTFIMSDMDGLKEINDTFGHTQGDYAICDAAEILRASVRRSDFVARYGGDEFVVIAATKEADKVVESIEFRIRELNEKRIRPYTLKLSYGVGSYLPDNLSHTPQEFLSYVDRLMYVKKNERRSDVQA